MVNAGLMITIGVVALIIYAIGASVPAKSTNNACVYTTNLISKGFFVIAFLPIMISAFV